MKCSKKCIYWTKDANLCIRSMECPEPPTAGKECPYGVLRNQRLTKKDCPILPTPEAGGVVYSAIYSKLFRYEELEEENRIIKLPCAIGETIFSVFRRKNFYVKKSTLTYYNMERVIADFGCTVFTNEQEAIERCNELNAILSQPDFWYEIKEDGTLFVYDGNAIIAEISDCGDVYTYREINNINNIFFETLTNSEYVNNKYSKKTVEEFISTWQRQKGIENEL